MYQAFKIKCVPLSWRGGTWEQEEEVDKDVDIIASPEEVGEKIQSAIPEGYRLMSLNEGAFIPDDEDAP